LEKSRDPQIISKRIVPNADVSRADSKPPRRSPSPSAHSRRPGSRTARLSSTGTWLQLQPPIRIRETQTTHRAKALCPAGVLPASPWPKGSAPMMACVLYSPPFASEKSLS